MKESNSLAQIKSIMALPFNVIVTVPIILVYFLNITWESNIYFSWASLILGFLFGMIGLILIITTIRLFSQKGKGTLAPWNPTQKLVVEGPYQYVRNPMISGVIFVLMSESLILQSFSILMWATLFFIINHVYFIRSEEPKLEEKFGVEYITYKKNVPRWIPIKRRGNCN